MYIQLNGQIIYYEKTGEGSPVILVHGNGETHKIFDALIPSLSKRHTVYALDSRGHGLSAAVNEFHYADMADDVVSFIHGLDLVKPAFYGFSDGGIVGLIAAFRHPSLFSSLAVSGANLTPFGWRFLPWLSTKLRYIKKKNPLIRLMLKEPHITKSDLSKRIASWLPNAILKILPGETHSSYVVHSPKLFPLLDDFFSNHCE